jgi:hypothetical protein
MSQAGGAAGPIPQTRECAPRSLLNNWRNKIMSKNLKAKHFTHRPAARFTAPQAQARASDSAAPIEVQLLSLVARNDKESEDQARALARETTITQQRQIRRSIWALFYILDEVCNEWEKVVDFPQPSDDVLHSQPRD